MTIHNELYVWVPTKGWVCIGAFTYFDTALELAHKLEPLEVKITDTKGRSYYGGMFCMPDHSQPRFNNLPKKGEHV